MRQGRLGFACSSRLTRAGTAAFNLFTTKRIPAQLHRLERIFTLMDRIEVGGNLVVHTTR